MAIVVAAIAALVIGMLIARKPTPTAAVPTPTLSGSNLERTVAEVEPNDSPSTAQDLGALPIVVTANWTGTSDQFRFRITNSGGWLLFAAVDGVTGLRLRLVREGDHGGERATVTTPGELGAVGTAEGSYLLVVEGDDKVPHGPYQLRAHIVQASSAKEWEPNDFPVTANEPYTVAVSEPDIAHLFIAGWLSRSDDVDCFRIPLKIPPAGAVLRFELVPPPGIALELDVYDSSVKQRYADARMVRAVGEPGKRLVLPNLGGRSWEPQYFACVQAHSGFAPGATYQLDVRTSTPTSPSEFEPNDVAGTASALPRGTGIDGYLAPGDVDWYRVSYEPQPLVHVTVTPPDDVRVAVTLHSDAKGELIRREAARRGEPVSIDASGVDLVEVYAAEGANVDKSYRIDAR